MTRYRPTSTLAIVSLAAGIAAWTILPIIGTILAIITGHMARNEIRRQHLDGDGLAILGLLLGYAHLAGAVLVICAILGFFGLFGTFLFLGT